MSATYSRRTCKCGREISAAGCAWHNHMMMHVRRGELSMSKPFASNLDSPHRNYIEWTWLKEPAKVK